MNKPILITELSELIELGTPITTVLLNVHMYSTECHYEAYNYLYKIKIPKGFNKELLNHLETILNE